jgi:hypothetical protein
MKIYEVTALYQNRVYGKCPRIAILVLFCCYVAFRFIGASGYDFLYCESCKGWESFRKTDISMWLS